MKIIFQGIELEYKNNLFSFSSMSLSSYISGEYTEYTINEMDNILLNYPFDFIDNFFIIDDEIKYKYKSGDLIRYIRKTKLEKLI